MIYTLLMDGLEFGHVYTEDEWNMRDEIRRHAMNIGIEIEMKEKQPPNMKYWWCE